MIGSLAAIQRLQWFMRLLLLWPTIGARRSVCAIGKEQRRRNRSLGVVVLATRLLAEANVFLLRPARCV
jgi:hypothetical protein